MQEGAHGDGQTEAWPWGQRWMVHQAGAGVLDLLGLLLYCRELLGKALGGVPNSPAWEMGASRKRALSTFFISARLSQRWHSWTTMVDIAFPRDHAVTFVARRAKSVAVRSSCINPELVLPSCTCLSALACQFTGLGRETRTVPPSGGVSWAQVHRDRSLHLGNARVPPGHSAVEASENGGGGRAASGRERGHPRLRQLLMHLREERHRGRARLGLSGLVTSSPMLTAARASMAISSGSGAAVATTPEGSSPTAPSSSEDVSPSPDAAIDILSTDGAPNEMLGAPWGRPAKSPGNRTGCSLREE